MKRMVALAALVSLPTAALSGGFVFAVTGKAPRTAVRATSARAAHTTPAPHVGPAVRSSLALVLDAERGETLYSKHPEQVAPIASITKLMTAMVVLDAGSPLDEWIAIGRADVDRLKHSESRLPVGGRLTRRDLLQVALMASDNRAASALARAHPGGVAACVEAMNGKARELGMLSTRFREPTGLSDENVASAADLARLVRAARGYPMIREATTTSSCSVRLASGRQLEFINSNLLVGNKAWDIELSKTGYINEAGRCLVMQANIATRKVIIVLLNSWGKYTRLGDANRIRKWMEGAPRPRVSALESRPQAGRQ